MLSYPFFHQSMTEFLFILSFSATSYNAKRMFLLSFPTKKGSFSYHRKLFSNNKISIQKITHIQSYFPPLYILIGITTTVKPNQSKAFFPIKCNCSGITGLRFQNNSTPVFPSGLLLSNFHKLMSHSLSAHCFMYPKFRDYQTITPFFRTGLNAGKELSFPAFFINNSPRRGFFPVRLV